MSQIGMGNSDAGKIFNNPAKNVGTSPTEIEKKLGTEAVEKIKEVVTNVKDTAPEFIKSPEGKAITTGVLLKTVMPFNIIGDAFILGGLAGCAKNYLESQQAQPVSKGAAQSIGKAAAAGAAAGAVAGAAGSAAAGAAKAASQAAEKTEPTPLQKAADTAAAAALSVVPGVGPLAAAALQAAKAISAAEADSARSAAKGAAQSAAEAIGKAAAEAVKENEKK